MCMQLYAVYDALNILDLQAQKIFIAKHVSANPEEYCMGQKHFTRRPSTCVNNETSFEFELLFGEFLMANLMHLFLTNTYCKHDETP